MISRLQRLLTRAIAHAERLRLRRAVTFLLHSKMALLRAGRRTCPTQ